MFSNFLFNICNLSGDWTMSSFAQNKIREIREKVGDKNVLCAMSGGWIPPWPPSWSTRQWQAAHLCVRGSRSPAER